MKTHHWWMIALAGIWLVDCILSARASEPQMVIHYYPQSAARGVIDWNCPVIAAYADDTIIWRRGWATSVAAFAVTKSEGANDILERIGALVTEYDGRCFRLTASIDAEDTVIWYRGKKVEIFGAWAEPLTIVSDNPELEERIRQINETERKHWASLPTALRNALVEVAAFDDPEGRPWRPDTLSITLLPAGAVLGAGVEWPGHWQRAFVPVNDDPSTVRGEFSGAMLDELLSVLARDGWPRAVVIDGKRKYASIRFVFPGESAWGDVREEASKGGVEGGGVEGRRRRGQ